MRGLRVAVAELKLYGNHGPRAAGWLLAIVFCAGCGKKPSSPAPAPDQSVVRGDRVVIEQTAATFFEGRVLAVDGQRLRVQKADEGLLDPGRLRSKTAGNEKTLDDRPDPPDTYQPR